MMSARTLGTWLLALSLFQPLVGQTGARRHFTVLGQDQGLPPGTVLDVAQDQDGFIWMGTENGLIRYEGGQARRWSTTEGLPSSYVARILAAPGGGLWVATLQGVVRFRNGVIEPVRFGGEVLSGNMAMDGGGRLWLTNEQGLFAQREGLAFACIAEGSGMAKPIWAPRSGTMLVPSPRGLRAYLADGSFRSWGPAEGLPEGGPKLVAEDGSGRIWAGSGRSLVEKEPGADRFTDHSSFLNASLTPNGAAYQDPDGSVWMPTQDGALRLGGDRKERLDSSGGLPFRWVRTVFRDREKTLWLIGPGLACLQGGRVWNYNLSGDFFGELVWAIARDADGTLLVGTDDGVARMGPAGLQRIPGTAGNRIKGLARDRQGILWMVGTIGSPLWLRPGAARAEIAPLGPPGFSANSVMVDTHGSVWIGHATQGLLRWDPALGRLAQEVSPAFAQVSTLCVFKTAEDAQGRLWAVTTQGLLVRDLDRQWHLFNEKDGLLQKSLHALAFLPDGSAWITYREPLGLSRVRVDGGRLTIMGGYPPKPGGGFSLIYSVQVDAQGQTWVGTDQGLNRLDPPLHVGSLEGMANEDSSLNALLVEEGRVWVGTAGGLVRYDLGGPPAAVAPPLAYILQMSLGSRSLEPPFSTFTEVPFREGSVAFRIASPTYAHQRGLHFQVRLQGLEHDWRDPEQHLISYPALAGGRYRFEVRAAIGSGPFGPITSLQFGVRPPWWKTWWAHLLEGLAAIAAVSGLVRIRVASLARSKAELEALVTQRTRELRGRNEELSAALGNVKQLSGLLPICASCKKIRDDSGYWNQLESYITQHTDVDFSHGICPECTEELFPEFSKRRQLPPA
jgi:ligand-binding sensor domain-containing protein